MFTANFPLPMDTLILRVFQFEVAMHCRFILAAAEEIAAVRPENLRAGQA